MKFFPVIFESFEAITADFIFFEVIRSFIRHRLNQNIPEFLNPDVRKEKVGNLTVSVFHSLEGIRNIVFSTAICVH